MDEKIDRWKLNRKTLESLHFDSIPKENSFDDNRFNHSMRVVSILKSSLHFCKKIYIDDNQKKARCIDAMFEWALDDLVKYLSRNSDKFRLIRILEEPTTEDRINKLIQLTKAETEFN